MQRKHNRATTESKYQKNKFDELEHLILPPASGG
jgi:hypothetical protein